MLILSGWTTGDVDIYSAAIAMTSFIPKVSKWVLATIAGIIGTVAAVRGILNQNNSLRRYDKKSFILDIIWKDQIY